MGQDNYYVLRYFDDGVTSCGGPWEREEQARYMASHVTPANGKGVSVLSERQDPVITSEKPLLLLGEHPGWPGTSVVVGPFRSHEDIAAFIAAALGASFRGVSMQRVNDWKIVTVEGGQEDDWPPSDPETT